MSGTSVAGVRYPGPARQLTHLLALRWSTLPIGQRVATGVGTTVLLAAVPAALLFGAVGAVGATGLDRQRLVEAVELTPGMLLVLAVGLIISAIASSGGREVVPRQQLVGFPVSPGTEHLASLVLAPVNLAWTTQVLAAAVLVGLHAADTAGSSSLSWPVVVLAAGVLYLAYVAALTTLGQLLAWVVELVRTLPGGVWGVRGTFAALIGLAILRIDPDVLVGLLSNAPTSVLTQRVESFADGSGAELVLVTLLLAAVAVGAGLAGARVYAVLLNRPPRAQSRSETGHHRPRRLPAADSPAATHRAWRRQDWASVLRSLPLRRGLLVLAIGPTVGALVAHVGWLDLVLFTSVVGAGAGLLFGVNMFALDGEGALWRENLPVAPRVWLVARLWVLTEIVAGTAALTTAAAMISARGTATTTAVVVAVLAVPTITAQVVSRCAVWSIDSPERAELRTTRDSPLSPGRMMAASGRLMGATVGVAVVLAVLARIDRPWLVPLVLVPFWVLSLLRLRTAIRRWDEPEVRAHVVQTVARG